jgi:hypothetical protein
MTFPAMVIVPLMQICWTLFSIISGLIYFQVYLPTPSTGTDISNQYVFPFNWSPPTRNNTHTRGCSPFQEYLTFTPLKAGMFALGVIVSCIDSEGCGQPLWH